MALAALPGQTRARRPGCSTERNSQDGVLITNSSATGTAWRSPVIISGTDASTIAWMII